MNRGHATMFDVVLWQCVAALSDRISYYQKLLREKNSLYVMRYKTRQHLRRLSPEQLDDVGISPEQAEAEIAKSFWEE